MACSYLSFAAHPLLPSAWCAVVNGHESFELFGISASWGFPSRLFGSRVEVVWKIFGVRMANLPIGGKSCVGLIDGLFRTGGLKDGDIREWVVNVP
jgi:hypothetical protein